ncbi:MAG: type IIL restriction-modification enzyme MmeI, partial [Betaproteobacteria bacterium]
VSGWYVKAARYMRRESAAAGALLPPPRAGEGWGGGVDPPIRAAFVSTNSITQGEQVGVLWGWLLAQGIKIAFAHRTFQWSNEARGVAAVHCVIVGFGYGEPESRTIFEYDDIRGEPHAVPALNINPYLVDAADVVLTKRSAPIAQVPPVSYGSMAIDDGHLILSADERRALLADCPDAERYVRRFVGGEEVLNGGERWCLWLADAPPRLLRECGEIRRRVALVRDFRGASGRATTVALAATPALFGEMRQPQRRYLAIPKVSSENRTYLPVALLDLETIASGSLLVMPGGGHYEFGVMASAMQIAWLRAVGGRMKSDLQFSSTLVYNNFPWPDAPTDAQRAKIEACAQAVLDARAAHPGASLADLYDPLTMPAALLQAHRALDAAVDAAYGRKSFKSDAERVAFLFERYQQLTSLLPAAKPAGKRKAAARPPR